MRFSEATGRKVVSTADASTVGTISGFVVDPATKKVVAVALGKTSGQGTMLPFGSIAAFGTDAVTVASADAVVAPDDRLTELSAKQHTILKKRALTTAGDEVGTVRDVEFDPTDGSLVSIQLDDHTWNGQGLVGAGSYAVMLRP
ncbi:PRC-barrel domain-containing protein [Nakamurella deserti]|uniref:PRC-barrel domain-containing protein n=1 Tax=Nakamurella deserti TaxID=2164074 RepID=UPI000DBE6F1B|nr:PRC-barrel domain-containing protein [Nakamurella deserti]